MAKRKDDGYDDFRYEIQSDAELKQAKLLITQGYFRNMDDYIHRLTRAEIKWMRQNAKKTTKEEK